MKHVKLTVGKVSPRLGSATLLSLAKKNSSKAPVGASTKAPHRVPISTALHDAVSQLIATGRIPDKDPSALVERLIREEMPKEGPGGIPARAAYVWNALQRHLGNDAKIGSKRGIHGVERILRAHPEAMEALGAAATYLITKPGTKKARVVAKLLQARLAALAPVSKGGAQ